MSRCSWGSDAGRRGCREGPSTSSRTILDDGSRSVRRGPRRWRGDADPSPRPWVGGSMRSRKGMPHAAPRSPNRSACHRRPGSRMVLETPRHAKRFAAGPLALDPVFGAKTGDRSPRRPGWLDGLRPPGSSPVRAGRRFPVGRRRDRPPRPAICLLESDSSRFGVHPCSRSQARPRNSA